MQVKKITAKIRDMVRVNLMENDIERAWYHNIELPDAIKELEMKDFGFQTLVGDKIEFQIFFEPGVLPKDFPEKKARNHRKAKADESKAAVPAPEAKPEAPAQDAKPAAPAPAITAIAKVEAKPEAPVAKPVPTTEVKADAKPVPAAPEAKNDAKPVPATEVKPKEAPKQEATPDTKPAATTRFPGLKGKEAAKQTTPPAKPAPKTDKRTAATK